MQEKITELLKEVVDPNTGKNLVASKSLKKVTTENGKTTVQIELDYPAKTQGPVIASMVRAKLTEAGIDADVNVGQNIIAHSVQPGVKVFDNVRNIIAVSSGKGGVGKSTVSANLALALLQEGAKVGLLDADVYGPSQPTMLSITDKPYSVDGKSLEPMIGHGLQVASVGRADRSGSADDLERPARRIRPAAASEADELERSGLSDCRYASGNRRYPAFSFSGSSADRCGGCDNTSGHRSDGCP